MSRTVISSILVVNEMKRYHDVCPHICATAHPQLLSVRGTKVNSVEEGSQQLLDGRNEMFSRISEGFGYLYAIWQKFTFLCLTTYPCSYL